MRLTPWEEERLLIFGAAELARRHRAAGLRLNAPEAVALICDAMLEAARAGGSYAAVEAAGLAALDPDDVIDGVRELVEDVRLEVLLEDGARLVVLVDPLGRGAPARTDGPGGLVPGEPVPLEAASPDGALEAGEAVGLAPASQARIELSVENHSTRVVRVSSHFPFERTNDRLAFDRQSARGFRLDLPAGSSARWSPGETRTVRLVRFAGEGGAAVEPGSASERGTAGEGGT